MPSRNRIDSQQDPNRAISVMVVTFLELGTGMQNDRTISP